MSDETPANIEFFRPPKKAQVLLHARRGIWNPTEETLHPARYARLYRLGHQTLQDEENLSSPWWSDYQAVQALRRFASTNTVSLTVAGRIFNAQAPEFGPADTLYTISLAVPIRTLRGLGRDIRSAGKIYAPPRTVTQTYVPGLRDPQRKCLSAIGRTVIESWEKSPVERGAMTIYGE